MVGVAVSFHSEVQLMRLKLKFANLATSREENLESHCNSEFTMKIFRMADACVFE